MSDDRRLGILDLKVHVVTPTGKAFCGVALSKHLPKEADPREVCEVCEDGAHREATQAREPQRLLAQSDVESLEALHSELVFTEGPPNLWLLKAKIVEILEVLVNAKGSHGD